MEAAIDDYIIPKNLNGLITLVIIAIFINLVMIAMIKLRTIIMAKMCNHILVKIRKDFIVKRKDLNGNKRENTFWSMKKRIKDKINEKIQKIKNEN